MKIRFPNIAIPKFGKKNQHNVGAVPGELFYTGEETSARIKITLIEFNDQEYFEKEYYDLSACYEDVKPGFIKWINIDGIHKLEVIESIGKQFHIHPLTLEDIVHVESRAKFEEYSKYAVSILKMLYYEKTVHAEHLSIVLFEDMVISFQEPHGGDAFDLIRNRLRESKGRIRKMGSDYLSYAIIDAVVDHYFYVIEKLGEKIEDLDEEVMNNPDRTTMVKIHELKRETQYVRKMILPSREMIINMLQSETDLIGQTNKLYLRDVHDHINRVSDTLENYRETLSGIMEIYLSNNSNKLNEVMKALTTISAIFIPVTFIAGVYGMNFKNMPELTSPFGYWITIGVMVSLMLGMGIYFKRRKWW
jgi:magnesium transporter